MAVARCSICILSVPTYSATKERSETESVEKKRSVQERGNKTGPGMGLLPAIAIFHVVWCYVATSQALATFLQQQQQQLWTATRWICLLFRCAKAELPSLQNKETADEHGRPSMNCGSNEIDTACNLMVNGRQEMISKYWTSKNY